MAINFLSKPKQKKSFALSQREMLIIFSALVALAAGWIFPINAVAESVFASIILLTVFPLFVIKFLLKEQLSDFGFSWGDKKTGLMLAGIAVVIFSVLNYLIIFTLGLKDQLIASPGVSGNFWTFLEYELFAATLSVFSLEFFFRGFIQLGLTNKFGIYALAAQAVLSTAIFYKNSWLVIFLHFLIYLAAGVIVQKSRSIAYSALAIWLISIAADIMLIKVILS